MTREDHIYNRKVQREYSERAFPRKVKIMIGTGILIGLLVALGMFIGFIRGLEYTIRQFNP